VDCSHGWMNRDCRFLIRWEKVEDDFGPLEMDRLS